MKREIRNGKEQKRVMNMKILPLNGIKITVAKLTTQCGYYMTFIHMEFFLLGIYFNCALSTKVYETLSLSRGSWVSETKYHGDHAF